MDANADPHFLEMIFSEDEEDEEYVPTEMELKASDSPLIRSKCHK